MEMGRMGERHLQRRDDCNELLIIMLYINCQIAALCCMYQLFLPSVHSFLYFYGYASTHMSTFYSAKLRKRHVELEMEIMEVDNGTTYPPSTVRQSTLIVQARCRLFNLYCQWSIDIRVNWRIGQTSLLSIMKPSSPCRRGFRLDSRFGYCRSSLMGDGQGES
jgi:hypothetical protein